MGELIKASCCTPLGYFTALLPQCLVLHHGDLALVAGLKLENIHTISRDGSSEVNGNACRCMSPCLSDTQNHTETCMPPLTLL